jgi:hypothetical protein
MHLLAILLSVLLRYTEADNPLGIFKLCLVGFMIAQFLVFDVVFCRSLFVILSLFFLLTIALYRMSLGLRHLITALISLSSSHSQALGGKNGFRISELQLEDVIPGWTENVMPK